ELELGGCPLGMQETAEYREYSIDLLPGDQLLLYTDGIIEARGAQGELYDLERLSAAVAGLAARPPDELVAALQADVEQFTRGRGLEDDFTLVAIAALPGAR
ncbi:MAG: serine/threonine-protein phosphatase, partial [Acetobacteraceae bacterium]|nr:serine/threonine-protein phosphatase [Acetobacteraceae bacterium]